MAQQSPPGQTLAGQQSFIWQPAVQFQQYGKPLTSPTSGTGQQSFRDAAASQGQNVQQFSMYSGSSGLGAQPSQGQGFIASSNSGGLYKPQPGGSSQPSLSSYYSVAAGEAPLTVGRVPKHPIYIYQSAGGWMHASDSLSRSSYDPDDVQMPLNALDIPGWATLEAEDQSGSSTQGSQQPSSADLTAARDVSVGSAANSQAPSNYWGASLNPFQLQQRNPSYVAAAQHSQSRVPALQNLHSGKLQGQDSYGTSAQDSLMGSQQSQGGYGATLNRQMHQHVPQKNQGK